MHVCLNSCCGKTSLELFSCYACLFFVKHDCILVIDMFDVLKNALRSQGGQVTDLAGQAACVFDSSLDEIVKHLDLGFTDCGSNLSHSVVVSKLDVKVFTLLSLVT